jgi:hypothetical protein
MLSSERSLFFSPFPLGDLISPCHFAMISGNSHKNRAPAIHNTPANTHNHDIAALSNRSPLSLIVIVTPIVFSDLLCTFVARTLARLDVLRSPVRILQAASKDNAHYRVVAGTRAFHNLMLVPLLVFRVVFPFPDKSPYRLVCVPLL